MVDPLHIGEIPEPRLRAWADQRVISSARYVDEIERRRAESERGNIITVPPLDYDLDELDLELAIDSPELLLEDVAAPIEAGPMFEVIEYVLLGLIAAVGGLGLWYFLKSVGWL